MAGDTGIDGRFRIGRSEFVFDLDQVVEETLHHVVTSHHVRAGGVLDQLLQAHAAAIRDVGQAQALAQAQLFCQLQDGAGRRLAREHMIGDGAERKHVQARAMRGIGAHGLWRQIHQARVFNVVLHMARAGGAMHRI